MLSYANVLARVLLYLQDSPASIFASSETEYGIENELKTISEDVPNIVDVVFKIESRTGTDVTGTTSSLTDLVKLQFVAGDATDEKVIHNTTDHTWAVVLANSSTSVNTLSADIMDTDENYEIYNKRCRNKKQIYIGDMPPYFGIKSVEYPIGTKRNFTQISEDVIELEIYDNKILDSDTTLTNLNNVEVLIKFAVTQVVCQLADLSGAVHTAGTTGAKTMQVKSFTDTQITEVGDIFTMANHRSTYMVTATLTFDNQASTGSSLSFFPGLEAATVGDDVITFLKSSLRPKHEDHLIRLVAGRAAISKSTESYAQVNTAITTISDAATAIAAIAARITQAVSDVVTGRTSAALGVTTTATVAAIITRGIADIASGRTEVAKVTTILDTANTELDKIGARLTQAATDITAGGTEAAKIPTIVTAAGTAIGAVAARITQAITDIASGRTAIALGVTAIDEAKTDIDLTATEVTLAKTALASGNSLLNTIPVGGGAPEYMGQAAADVGVAQGYILSGQGLLQKASADFNNANADYGAAAREIEAGMAKVREAQANLEQANTDMGANRTYIDQANAQIGLAQGYFQEAQGYVMEGNARMAQNASYIQDASAEFGAASSKVREVNADLANAASYYNAAATELRASSEKAGEAVVNLRLVATRLQVSQGGLRYEEWGRREIAQVETELRAYAGIHTSVRYPRD